MINVVAMYHFFVARVIGTSDSDSIERHCKAFLTNVHKLDLALSNRNSIPMLLTKYYLLTLLNAADAVRRFGSARSLWEGGMMGEGGIPRLKQRKHNMKKGFAKNALHSFFAKEAMIDMIDHAIGNIKKCTETNTDVDLPLESLMESARTIATDGGDTQVTDSFESTDRVLDRENNLIGSVSIEDIFQSCPVIKIVVNKLDKNIYVLDDKKLRTFLNLFVLPTAVKEYGCYYFSTEVSPLPIANTTLKKDDLVCSLLCQHNTLPSYFYAISMDW